MSIARKERPMLIDTERIDSEKPQTDARPEIVPPVAPPPTRLDGDPPSKGRTLLRRALLPLIVVAVTAAFGFAAWRKWGAAEDVTYQTGTITKGPIVATVSATGNCNAVV